jgi:hypothetical protein
VQQPRAGQQHSAEQQQHSAEQQQQHQGGRVKQEPPGGELQKASAKVRALTIHLSDSSAAEGDDGDGAAALKAELDFSTLISNCSNAIGRSSYYSADAANVFTLHYWSKKARDQVTAVRPAGAPPASNKTQLIAEFSPNSWRTPC